MPCTAAIRSSDVALRTTWFFLHSVGPLNPGNLHGNQYKYIRDLQALEATASGTGPSCFCPATTSVQQAWCQALLGHPDSEFVAYILSGITQGMHIGVDRPRAIHLSREGNLPSVRQHPSIVVKHVAAERAAGRLLGPLPPHLALTCQISPIGLIPKPHQPGKWRLIVDLSSPHGASINDAISAEVSHMQYA